MLLTDSCHLSSDPVQISLSLKCYLVAPIFVRLYHFQPFQGVEDPAGHTLGASGKWLSLTVSLLSSVDLGHRANPSTTAKVQMLCCGRS